MTAFDIEISCPFASGVRAVHGGPDEGGHHGAKNWYNQFGMDLGADVGTQVLAVFEGHVTRLNPPPVKTKGGEFGAQIFIRSPNDQMGGFYTHITDVAPGLKAGSVVERGDLLGTIAPFTPPHLHLALVEIIGGAPGGRYLGVANLYNRLFKGMSGASVAIVSFQQNGTPPTFTLVP